MSLVRAWSAHHIGIQPKHHVCAWSAYHTGRQAAKAPKAGQTEPQVAATACPTPKPGSQASGVCNSIGFASSLLLGPARTP